MTTSHIAHVCAQVRIQRQDDILYSAHNYYLQQQVNQRIIMHTQRLYSTRTLIILVC